MWYLVGAGVLHENQMEHSTLGSLGDTLKMVNTGPSHTGCWGPSNMCGAPVNQNWSHARLFGWTNGKEGQNTDILENIVCMGIIPTDIKRRWQFVPKYSSDEIHWGRRGTIRYCYSDRSSWLPTILSVVSGHCVPGLWNQYAYLQLAISLKTRPTRRSSSLHLIIQRKEEVPIKIQIYWFTQVIREPRHPEFQVDPGILEIRCTIAYESIMLVILTVL